jgi:hypothetical protein
MKMPRTILNRRDTEAERRASALAAAHFPGCPAHRREAGRPDSLDAIELELALEEDKLALRDAARLAIRLAANDMVMKPPLGPWAAERSRRDPRTIRMRSVRGVINERVRHSGGCVCAETPPRMPGEVL